MSKTQVAIAGAGPTGLMLAYELALAGVDVVVLDALAGRTGQSRAGGMHARTMEVLDQRGILADFLAEGRPLPIAHFSGLRLDVSDFATRYPHLLVLMQFKTERLLEERVREMGVEVRWNSEVTAVKDGPDGIDVEVRGQDGSQWINAQYLVGCDGGRSTVRKAVGIGFSGTDATLTSMLGDVELSDPPDHPIFQERRPGGDFSVLSLEPGWYRILTTEHVVADRNAPCGFEDLRATFTALAGTDYGMHSPRWISRFSDATRQADQYRSGRVLLAGDSAHIHYPSGGQGMNLGIQDAVNLGWKLAGVVSGHMPQSILDTYHTERHPVAARVLDNTRAQTVLSRPGPHIDALRDTFARLVGITEVNAALGEMITGLDIAYPMPGDHPLLGRRVPDADLVIDGEPVRLYSLLHTGHGILLNLDDPAELTELSRPWGDRVDLVAAKADGEQWTVPSVGAIDTPAAVLIRPDGYVAWAAYCGAALASESLRTALDTWFGPGRP